MLSSSFLYCIVLSVISYFLCLISLFSSVLCYVIDLKTFRLSFIFCLMSCRRTFNLPSVFCLITLLRC